MRIQIFIPKEFEIIYKKLVETTKEDEKFKEVVKRFQKEDKRIKSNQRSIMFRYIMAYYLKQKRDEQKLKENSQKDITHDTSGQAL